MPVQDRPQSYRETHLKKKKIGLLTSCLEDERKPERKGSQGKASPAEGWGRALGIQNKKRKEDGAVRQDERVAGEDSTGGPGNMM